MMKTTSPLPRCFFRPLAAAMVTGLLPAALRAASYIGCRMPCGMPWFFASMVISRSTASPTMSSMIAPLRNSPHELGASPPDRTRAILASTRCPSGITVWKRGIGEMTSISLRYFATAARRGSIREAAEDLHVAQSAISRQIQKLEQDFGVPPFPRHARGVELTSAGKIFLRHARSSMRHTEPVRSELDALKGLRRGTINIQAIESLWPGGLPQAIMRFRARYPGITFEVIVERTHPTIRALPS